MSELMRRIENLTDGMGLSAYVNSVKRLFLSFIARLGGDTGNTVAIRVLCAINGDCGGHTREGKNLSLSWVIRMEVLTR